MKPCPPNRARRGVEHAAWLLAALSLALATATPLRAQSGETRGAAKADVVERYLARLGLDDLRIRHLEQVLSQTRETAPRRALARRLTDAYVERLLAAADDPAKFDELEQRVRRLVAEVPEVDTPELKVLLLQAEYQQLESSMLAWLAGETASQPPADVARDLARLADEFAERQKMLSADIDSRTAQLDDETKRAARPQIEQQLNQKQSLMARAQFFAGWSRYYLGVARRGAAAGGGGDSSPFELAKEAFVDLLGVFDNDEYADVDPESLALESVWRSRAVIGLGLSEIALGRMTAAERCFAWLQHSSVSLVLRDQGPYWHLQGLLNAGKTAEAIALAEQQLSTFAADQPAAKTSFCVLLVRTAFGKAADQRAGDAEIARLGELGILGLARLRQFDALSTLATKYDLRGTTPQTEFYLDWLAARRKFTEGEKSKDADAYRAALALFEQAVKSPEAERDLAVGGRCRLGLAWCEFRLEKLESAAQHFHDAGPLLRAETPDDALQAAWMEAACYYQLAGQEKRFTSQAEQALEGVMRDFPKAPQAARAQWLLEELKPELASPQEKIRRLSAIPSSDPRHVDALFELCELHHLLWSENKENKTKADPLAESTIDAAERFIAAAPESDGARKARAALLGLDPLLASANSSRKVETLLGEGLAAATNLADNAPGVAELHFRRLQWAQKQNAAPIVADEARWIAQHAAGTPYELPALMLVAKQADAAVDDAAKRDAAGLAEKQAAAAAHYARLVELLGDSPETIRSTRNALAASSRLARYLEDQKKWQEAAARLRAIVAAYPDDRNYLRRLALAETESGRPKDALDHWRKLLAGLPGGSDGWLEAKYYQLACLLKTDPAEAAVVWKQFRLLYPEVKSPAWSEKFAALADRF